MELRWHPYRYYPYERELARREISALLSPTAVHEQPHGFSLEGPVARAALDRLVYFAEFSDGEQQVPLLQARLERESSGGASRQSTRYSVHGLHEYKGKFNPQIARALLNILQVSGNGRVLDPFCGSGTSLVECSHVGISSLGVDINPLAVFVANAKLAALQIAADQLRAELDQALRRYRGSRAPKQGASDVRAEYLGKWFEPEILDTIERLRNALLQGDSRCSSILLTIASNLLRDYSLQDPVDLRIRRRKTPIPETPLIEAFEQEARAFFTKQECAQAAFVQKCPTAQALLGDIRKLLAPERPGPNLGRFDCAITSPPYATALPYIDTQRLSLIWLGLLTPSEVQHLEARLVGSREVRGESKKTLLAELLENRRQIPEEQLQYCLQLQGSLTDSDGFRRQAVPLLLYRYFADMAQAFGSVRKCLKDNAPFALIVGSNHTVLSGKRFDIDTPAHLAHLAKSCGWFHQETMPLQTYQRFGGYHMSNAIHSESLVILRAV